jgi:glycosyltransferase involved in cell wall biosynthesis
VPTEESAGGRAPVAIWCGRLQRWKGAHVFLRAAAIARRSVPNARFIVVGGSLMGLEPEYHAELRSLVASLDLGPAVRFAGHQASVAPFLAEADIVVHSAIAPEPFGLVILEAMLAARPVVASAEGGPLEIVEPEVTGVLVPPGDAGALAAALVRLFGDRDLRARMGDAGRARAGREFSAPVMARRFEALYAELAGGAGAREGKAA